MTSTLSAALGSRVGCSPLTACTGAEAAPGTGRHNRGRCLGCLCINVGMLLRVIAALFKPTAAPAAAYIATR